VKSITLQITLRFSFHQLNAVAESIEDVRAALAIQWRLGYVHLAGGVMDAGDELVEPFHEESGVRLVYHINDLDAPQIRPCSPDRKLRNTFAFGKFVNSQAVWIFQQTVMRLQVCNTFIYSVGMNWKFQESS
jgi:hypothetical protein